MDIIPVLVSVCCNTGDFHLMETMFPQLNIHLVQYQEGISPWIQNRLYTPFWRYYWDPVPGGVLECGGKTVELTPDTVTIIPGYLVFSTRAEQPFSQYYIHFNPPGIVAPPSHPEIRRLPLRPEWKRGWEEFKTLLHQPTAAFRRAAITKSLLLAALLELPPEVLKVAPEQDPRIERVRREIAARIANPPDNAELARIAGLNRESFVRLFHRECGESPGQLSRRLRIEHACGLLHYSNRSIDEIAELCGFADRYHFSRVFARIMRNAAAAFRRMRD